MMFTNKKAEEIHWNEEPAVEQKITCPILSYRHIIRNTTDSLSFKLNNHYLGSTNKHITSTVDHFLILNYYNFPIEFLL